jgi:hypothetical protein
LPACASAGGGRRSHRPCQRTARPPPGTLAASASHPLVSAGNPERRGCLFLYWRAPLSVLGPLGATLSPRPGNPPWIRAHGLAAYVRRFSVHSRFKQGGAYVAAVNVNVGAGERATNPAAVDEMSIQWSEKRRPHMLCVPRRVRDPLMQPTVFAGSWVDLCQETRANAAANRPLNRSV